MKPTPVYQFNSKGLMLDSFPSIIKASDSLGIHISCISMSAKYSTFYKKKWYFSFSLNFKPKPLKKKKKKYHPPVYCFNSNFKHVATFTSVKDASNLTHVPISLIFNSIYREYFCHKQFYFSFNKKFTPKEKKHNCNPALRKIKTPLPKKEKKKIYQFDVNGKLINSFTDIKQASIDTSINLLTLYNARSGHHLVNGDFYFSDDINFGKIISATTDTYYLFNRQGLLIDTQKSLKVIAKKYEVNKSHLGTYINDGNFCHKKFYISRSEDFGKSIIQK